MIKRRSLDELPWARACGEIRELVVRLGYVYVDRRRAPLTELARGETHLLGVSKSHV